MQKLEDKFAWGCSSCDNFETFKNIKENKDVIENYCVHAQVVFMLIDEDDMQTKYDEPKLVIEVLSEKPYYTVAHAGKHPAMIHFPRQTKLLIAVNILAPIRQEQVSVNICLFMTNNSERKTQMLSLQQATATPEQRPGLARNWKPCITMKTRIMPAKNVDKIEG